MGKRFFWGGVVCLALTTSACAEFLGFDWNSITLAIGLLLLLIIVGLAFQKINKDKRERIEEVGKEEERLKNLSALIPCPICKKEISRAATACPSCGHPINPQAKETIQHSWSPGVAAVLSLFIPGAGQIYKGKIGAGILWLIFVVGGYFLFIIPGAILHLVCIFNAAQTEK